MISPFFLNEIIYKVNPLITPHIKVLRLKLSKNRNSYFILTHFDIKRQISHNFINFFNRVLLNLIIVSYFYEGNLRQINWCKENTWLLKKK